ncbi:hypothetical protein ABGB08_48950 [Acrocarpospora sp. B8E8]
MSIAYELNFPDYLTDYEIETEAKGYLANLEIISQGKRYLLNVYDPVRLSQDIETEITSDGYFSSANILIVPAVTRDEIRQAIQKIAVGTFANHWTSQAADQTA